MNSIILATMFLFNDPTGAPDPICDDAQETIDALEAELEAHERTILLADQVFLDFFFAANPTGGTGATCEKPPGLEQDICECISTNNNGHPTLTDCITDKQGGPTGGL